MDLNLSKEWPFASIVIPTFNRKSLLSYCLKSLLDLDYPPGKMEIIIVDDGSSDGTGEFLLSNFKLSFGRIKYLRSEWNKGPAASRNAGFAQARGELIVSMDDDCRVEISWLKDLVETFNCFPAASAVGGSVVNPTALPLAEASHILEFSSWLPLGNTRRVNDIPACNIAYKKADIQGLSFREDFKGSVYEDALFNRDLTSSGKAIIFNPKIKVFHYKWPQDFSKDDFYKSQTRYATGFLKGGFLVHGFWGKFLIRYKIFNLLCPRLALVFLRCLKSKLYLSQFISNFSLILDGEWYRSKLIYRGLS
jgi:glycosyltransferase involved in cell wall biosynthesis